MFIPKSEDHDNTLVHWTRTIQFLSLFVEHFLEGWTNNIGFDLCLAWPSICVLMCLDLLTVLVSSLRVGIMDPLLRLLKYYGNGRVDCYDNLLALHTHMIDY